MLSSTFVLVMLAGPHSETDPRSVCRDLRAQLETILSASGFEGSHFGVYVHDLGTDRPIFGHNADQTFVPASNVKIITTAAALHYLGTDHRFHTEIYGDIDSHGVVGNLWIKGDGDPWLVPERVWFLASRLPYAGVTAIKGDIIVDDTYFDGPRVAEGWEQDRSSFAYMAPRGAVSVGFNTLVVHVYPGRALGSPAEVLVEPRSDYARLDASVITTRPNHSGVTIDVLPDGDRSVIRVTGSIGLREQGRGYYRRVDNPPLYAGEVFKQAFKQAGITVRGGRVRTGAVPPDVGRIASLPSPRLAEIIGRVNMHSNNFMAEQIALATGAHLLGPPATWEKAEIAIEKFLVEEVGLAKGSFAIHNASGLHDVNRFTPRQVVEVLKTMYKRPRLRPEYLASMSVAGTSGTLASRMRDSDATGLVRAKTGTLSISSALSGYVTAKRGEEIAFSILVNDYTAAISDVLAAQDEVGTTLASYDSECPSGGPVVSSSTLGNDEIALP